MSGSKGTANATEEEITELVRSRYAAMAGVGLSSAREGVRAVAEAFGYTPEELQAIPEGANLGLSCGNPTATANLRPGEVVVDLGSGAGLDVFLAARKVGPSGKAIGIDMTPEMLAQARANLEQARDDAGRPLMNVEFHHATIDQLPLADGTVDCVISNCVVNLAPDKNAVFREIARVLKPGGRVAISDIALKQPLPPELANDLMAYIGCIAGAISIEEYRAGLLAAGFAQVEVIDSGADLNAYAKVENQSACCTLPATPTAQASVPSHGPALTMLQEPPEPVSSSCCGGPAATMKEKVNVHERLADLLTRYDINAYAASVKVFAVKPILTA